MPDQSSHLADFRKSRHKLFCYASIYRGRRVVEAAISGLAPSTAVLFVTIGTGVHTDIRPGFRVDIFTDDGRFKGRTRISYDGVITANVFHIRETEAGTISLAVGDIVRVYRDVRQSDKLVAALETFPPDGEQYSDQTDLFRPLVGSSGAYAGWTRMLPAVMTDYSAALDPDSSGELTHLWDADGLSYASGSSSSASPTFTGTWGEYCPSHTVTDDDNGKSSDQFIPVILHDKAHPPYKVQIEALPNDEARGGSARVRFLDRLPYAPEDDGALIILWKEEWIAATRQSFGARAPGRSHILLVGILRSEEGEGDGDTRAESLTFEVISPLARLDELMGYGHVMLRDAAPDAWNKVRALTTWIGMALIYLVYTNANEAGYDFVQTSTYQEDDYSGLFSDQSTPLQQLRSLADATDCRFVEDRRGRFEAQMRPELVALSDRAALPRTLVLQARDIKTWRYTREHWRTANRVEVHGLVAGATEAENLPLFCEWVGAGEGVQSTTIERKIISASNPVQNLKERTGRLGAAQDGVYVDADGALQMALDLELTLRGVYDVFDFYDDVLEFQVTTNQRGFDFSDHLFVFVGSSVSFEGGTAETTARFRTCTNGAEGQLFLAPSTSYIPETTLPPAAPISLPSAFPGLLGRGVQRLALVCANGVALTNDFQTPAIAGGPTWRMDYAKPWTITNTLCQWVPNGFDPGSGWIVTDGEVGDLTLATGAYSILHSFAAAAAIRSADASFAQNGFVAVASYYPGGGGTKVLHSADGITFTETVAHSDATNPDAGAGCYVSSKTAGRIVVGAFTSAGVSNLYQSSDYGASWTAFSPAAPSSVIDFIHLHAPWANNPNDDILFFPSALDALGSAGSHRFFRRVAGVDVDISPVYAGRKHMPYAARNTAETSVLNPNRLLLVGTDAGSVNGFGVFLSHTARAAVPTYAVVIAPNCDCRRLALAGDDPDTAWGFGVNDFLEQWHISGNTVTRDDRSGNLATLGLGEILAVAGW